MATRKKSSTDDLTPRGNLPSRSLPAGFPGRQPKVKSFGPTKRYSAKRKPQLVKAYGFIPTKRVK